jgi:hypothetical protein
MTGLVAKIQKSRWSEPPGRDSGRHGGGVDAMLRSVTRVGSSKSKGSLSYKSLNKKSNSESHSS